MSERTEKITSLVWVKTGHEPHFKFTTWGVEVGLPLPDGRWVISLMPIDDESDERFAEALAASWWDVKAGRRVLPDMPQHR